MTTKLTYIVSHQRKAKRTRTVQVGVCENEDLSLELEHSIDNIEVYEHLFENTESDSDEVDVYEHMFENTESDCDDFSQDIPGKFLHSKVLFMTG